MDPLLSLAPIRFLCSRTISASPSAARRLIRATVAASVQAPTSARCLPRAVEIARPLRIPYKSFLNKDKQKDFINLLVYVPAV